MERVEREEVLAGLGAGLCRPLSQEKLVNLGENSDPKIDAQEPSVRKAIGTELLCA